MTRKLLLLFLVLATGLTACRQDSPERPASDELLEASLRLAWIPSGTYSGEITAMNLFDEAHGLDLAIEPGGPGINSITMVQTGQNDFGAVGADEVFAANEQGADLVIIGVVNYHSPAAFVSLENSGIRTPNDFEGRRVGLLPFGATGMVYEALLAENDVERSRVEELAVSPDLRPFIQGAYDVQPVFAYDETVTLDQQGIAYNLIDPNDFGVDFKGPVYVTTRETLRERPELVRAFVETMADGWNYALTHQGEAIGYLKAFAPEIDSTREARVLERGAPYFRGYQDQPLNADEASFAPMAAEMVRQEILRRSPQLDSTLYLQYIQDYYARQNSPS